MSSQSQIESVEYMKEWIKQNKNFKKLKKRIDK